MDGVGKSGSPAPRSITSSPAALRRFASCEIAMVADVSRCCRLGDRPEPGGMRGSIAPRVGPPVASVAVDDAAAAEWPAVRPAGLRVHAVTGLVRSASRLKQRPPQVLAGAVKDLAALVQRAALKLDHVTSLVVAWPEALIAGEHAAALDALLGEAREARRLVLSWNPALLADPLERHARRPLVVGPLPG